ncbi:oxidoreductase [Clohesyomyces aquaticus]|uniref:mRNA N(6)-methyladenine demethylase n=1 Tax=Clohesyomyces aquaticus TaxID=1231657 RepID=A0A1Y1YQD1_9PLEO|nr:oxidoreductase [Clohesyomyces aquaticus]
MTHMEKLDPHERPPDSVRNVYKKYQKMKPKDLDQDPELIAINPGSTVPHADGISLVAELDPARLHQVLHAFSPSTSDGVFADSPVPVFEHDDMPGLHIIPSLLPPEIQQILLSKLLHRDLANPAHLTNIHTHYKIGYPSTESFFSMSPHPSSHVATPLDPSVHRPLTVSQLLNRKMRWMTLGGQYDWTQKRYPDSAPPAFPSDIKELLEGIFTSTKAEAAIVNLYSPGDTLSMHRDVAEDCDRGLISISLGCDAIFVIGTTSEGGAETVLTLRLRSGSAVYMSGSSRFAWHGVPQIVPGTCPLYLQQWPADDTNDQYKEWRGWMSSKRVNLNVRQMWEAS